MKNITVIVFLFFVQFGFSQVDSLKYYFQKGDHQNSIKYGEKQRKRATKKDSNYSLLVNNLGSAYSRIGDFKNAEINYLEAVEIQKQIFGENSKIVAATYDSLGNTFVTSSDKLKAKNYFLKAIDIFEKPQNSKLLNYPNCLLNLAIVYKETKDFQNAEITYLKAEQLLKINHGENDINYQNALISIAIFYDQIENFLKAEEYFINSYNLQKINLNSETISTFIFTVDTIALYYSGKNKLELSEKFYLESIELKEKYLGKNNLEYCQALINAGILYSKKNQIKEKYDYLVQANKQLITINKEYSSENAFVLGALASREVISAKYTEAEKLYLKIIDIYEKLGDKTENYYDCQLSLAYNYINQGDFSNAEKIYTKLGTIDFQENPKFLFKILSKSIDFYLELENSEKVKIYVIKFDDLYLKIKATLKESDFEHIEYNRTLQMSKSFLGENEESLKYAKERCYLLEKNPSFKNLDGAYQTALSDLALAYKENGNYADWKLYKFKVYDLLKDKIGERPRNDASNLMAIANIYHYENDYANAEKYYLDAIKLIEDKVNINIDMYDDALLYLISLYADSKSAKANPLIIKLISKSSNNIAKFISFLSNDEFQKIKKLKERHRIFSYYQLYSNPTQFPELNIGCYENELLLKNLSLRNQQRIKNSIEKSNDTALKEKYQQFIANKRYLNKLDELPITEKPLDYENLKNDTENLEKDITRLSSDFADAKKTLSVTYKQIQDKLQPNEVAIDMVSYNYYNKKWTDSLVYGAFVIKKDSKFPKYITLFEQKQLENLLKKESDTLDVSRINTQYQSKAIADLFLKPLESDLKDIKTIYLSPSGLGHQINFLALPVSATQTLGDAFQVHILGSTSEIVNYKTASLDKKSNLELILYGNIDYDKSDVTEKTTTDSLAVDNTEFASLTTRSTSTAIIKYLRYTKTEINKINALAQQNNFKSTIIDDKFATEESIKLLDGKKTLFVLHLATHGFFFPDPKTEAPKNQNSNEKAKSSFYKMADDPMMRSGLLLAGANKFWAKPTENITTDDGILTANEISNLDLSSCQLVVMSACETGLGDISGSEGVFGLQRAFKMAGVKNIIMSLWKIDDEKTVEFFDIFYANCFTGKTIREAFQLAQTQMKTKYTPYYWAGFILLE